MRICDGVVTVKCLIALSLNNTFDRPVRMENATLDFQSRERKTR